MSIVAYYARVADADLKSLREDPERYWKLQEMPWDLSDKVGPSGSEVLYLDKDWQVLSWLCSDLGRAEERRQAALMSVDLGVHDKVAFKAELKKGVEALGLSYVDPDTLPLDPVLTAIQGRREGDEGEAIADLGLAAVVFVPSEVRSLLSSLEALDEDALRERFDIDEMEALALPTDGEETELDEFVLPQLRRLKTLYSRAAAAGQHVVLVMS